MSEKEKFDKRQHKKHKKRKRKKSKKRKKVKFGGKKEYINCNFQANVCLNIQSELSVQT
jgi:hypothetical protein